MVGVWKLRSADRLSSRAGDSKPELSDASAEPRAQSEHSPRVNSQKYDDRFWSSAQSACSLNRSLACAMVAPVTSPSLPEMPPARRDGCTHAPACKVSGLMCFAFDHFVIERPWKQSPREPSAVATSLSGLTQQAQIVRERHFEAILKRRARQRAHIAKRHAASVTT
jgi:hypothetical protein